MGTRFPTHASLVLAGLVHVLGACKPSGVLVLPPTTQDAPDSGLSLAEPGLSVPPYVQLREPGSAHLRFEMVLDDRASEVEVSMDGGAVEVLEPELWASDVDYSWDVGDPDVAHPDQPGLHVIHELIFEDLMPGTQVAYTVHAPDEEPWSGSFRMPPPPGEPFRVAFVGDTLWPVSASIYTDMATHEPDLLLHGGDLQYQTYADDTWSGSMYDQAPVAARALFQPTIGNHEYEGLDEFGLMYSRLFSQMGDSGPIEYYAFTYGGWRFFALNGETDLGDEGSLQQVWLDAQLERVAEDPDIIGTVAFLHRPSYTLGRHMPELDVRDALEPRFGGGRGALVLAAHNHSYERFEVDGTTWLVDGGGGAGLYDIDEHLDYLPEDAELRVTGSTSHGYTILDFEGDGSIVLRRFALGQGLVDEVTLQP